MSAQTIEDAPVAGLTASQPAAKLGGAHLSPAIKTDADLSRALDAGQRNRTGETPACVAAHPTPAARRVLVADDDAVTMRIVITILEREGYEVVACRDGRAAYRRLQSDAAFSAAIFDMNMPHLRGLDIINYMRTEKRLMRIPVMIMTAEPDLKLCGESFAAGVALFLRKPFTTLQMRTMLSLLVKQAAARMT